MYLFHWLFRTIGVSLIGLALIALYWIGFTFPRINDAAHQTQAVMMSVVIVLSALTLTGSWVVWVSELYYFFTIRQYVKKLTKYRRSYSALTVEGGRITVYRPSRNPMVAISSPNGEVIQEFFAWGNPLGARTIDLKYHDTTHHPQIVGVHRKRTDKQSLHVTSSVLRALSRQLVFATRY